MDSSPATTSRCCVRAGSRTVIHRAPVPPASQSGQPQSPGIPARIDTCPTPGLHWPAEIAWLADPIDAMSLHIRAPAGLTDRNGAPHQCAWRLAAPTTSLSRAFFNGWPTRARPHDGAVKVHQTWAAQNRVQQLLWSNPRYVFFRKKPSSDFDAAFGPKGTRRGADTGPLDRGGPWRHPYGTPVWLASAGALSTCKNWSSGTPAAPSSARCARLLRRHRPRRGPPGDPATSPCGSGAVAQMSAPTTLLAAVGVALVLTACGPRAVASPSGPSRRHCIHRRCGVPLRAGRWFGHVRPGLCRVDGPRGRQVLLRDAGGLTPDKRSTATRACGSSSVWAGWPAGAAAHADARRGAAACAA
jgi:hypothetical protein